LKILIISLLIITSFSVKSQVKNPVFDQAILKLQASDYEGAILLLDQVILKTPTDYPALYNRAVAKSILRKYEEAFVDINKAIIVRKDAKKAFLHRGIIRKKLTDYEGAHVDFDFALKIDPKYADAIYNKGVLFEYLGKYEEACLEFNKAKDAGSAAAYPKVDFCETPINERVKTYSILKLETISTDKTYGFSPKNPIKVGAGINGGVENEQTYLDLLRDETGQSIKYMFKEKGPDFVSKSSPGGKAFLTKYELKYLQKDGKVKTATIFFNHFEFITPQILMGFATITPFLQK
jgi:tetratricopeptide (TPR) repeat protein